MVQNMFVVGIDCVTGKLGQPYSIEHNATPPVHYVVAFNEGSVIMLSFDILNY